MSGLFPELPIPISAQIQELERELAMRRHVYPRQIAAGRLSERKAQEQIDTLTAAIETLRGVDK